MRAKSDARPATDANAVRRLNAFGQSPWLDYLSRDLVRSRELERLRERWDLRGLTSNPAIFEKAIVHSGDYDSDIRAAAAAGRSALEIYDLLVIDDVGRAADHFTTVHGTTDRRDGYVSIEVSPLIADDAEATVAEATRLNAALDRPNVMIKVPATDAGLHAIEELTALGINVNVTLLFSLERYRDVVHAYLAGLERAAIFGRNLAGIASVASFFLSRIDTLVDAELEELAERSGYGASRAPALRGQAAIASARLAYRIFEEEAASRRFLELDARGGRMQRLLWASTGTKNPDYDEIRYIEPLIGAGTVSTMPLETLEAYERKGSPAATLPGNVAEAQAVTAELEDLGIDLETVAGRLLTEGIDKFARPYDATLAAIERAA